MLQENIPESAEAAAALRELLPSEMLFETAIPREDVFIRASARGLPVGALEEGQSIETVFDELYNEVRSKISRTQHNLSPKES